MCKIVLKMLYQKIRTDPESKPLQTGLKSHNSNFVVKYMEGGSYFFDKIANF